MVGRLAACHSGFDDTHAVSVNTNQDCHQAILRYILAPLAGWSCLCFVFFFTCSLLYLICFFFFLSFHGIFFRPPESVHCALYNVMADGNVRMRTVVRIHRQARMNTKSRKTVGEEANTGSGEPHDLLPLYSTILLCKRHGGAQWICCFFLFVCCCSSSLLLYPISFKWVRSYTHIYRRIQKNVLHLVWFGFEYAHSALFLLIASKMKTKARQIFAEIYGSVDWICNTNCFHANKIENEKLYECYATRCCL